MMNQTVGLALLLISATSLAAQRRIITASVIDSTTQHPVHGGAAELEPCDSGCRTRFWYSGTFTLSAPLKSVTLTVIGPGYEIATLSVPPDTNTVRVVLKRRKRSDAERLSRIDWRSSCPTVLHGTGPDIRAIQCVERFIAENGYTEAPAKVDSTSIAPESLRFYLWTWKE